MGNAFVVQALARGIMRGPMQRAEARTTNGGYSFLIRATQTRVTAGAGERCRLRGRGPALRQDALVEVPKLGRHALVAEDVGESLPAFDAEPIAKDRIASQ